MNYHGGASLSLSQRECANRDYQMSCAHGIFVFSFCGGTLPRKCMFYMFSLGWPCSLPQNVLISYVVMTIRLRGFECAMGQHTEQGSEHIPKMEPARAQWRETGRDGEHFGSIYEALEGQRADLGGQVYANEAPKRAQREP